MKQPLQPKMPRRPLAARLAAGASCLGAILLLGTLLAACDYLPTDHDNEGGGDEMPGSTIPETARGPAIDPERGYIVQEIRNGLYWVGDGAYMAMFLVTEEGVVFVDAPPTLGEHLLRAVADVTEQPVTHLVYSHHHGDHIGAASLFPDGIEIVAHAETERLLRRETACTDCLGERPLPTTTFEDTYTLEVGGQRLELAYRGPNHTSDNVFIYAPHQKTLMLVDVVFPGWVPFDRLALAENVPGYVEAYDEVLGYDFETFIGGHVTRPGTRADVATAQQYVLAVQAGAREALLSVDRPGFVGELGQEIGFEDVWALFGPYTDLISETCAEEVLAEWQNRLGGAETFTESHCNTMQYSIRID